MKHLGFAVKEFHISRVKPTDLRAAFHRLTNGNPKAQCTRAFAQANFVMFLANQIIVMLAHVRRLQTSAVTST